MLRFCRARKFVLEDVKTMFLNFIEWRQVNKVDSIITDFDFKEEKLVKIHYPFNLHGVDKEGRPVSITQIGNINCEKLF